MAFRLVDIATLMSHHRGIVAASCLLYLNTSLVWHFVGLRCNSTAHKHTTLRATAPTLCRLLGDAEPVCFFVVMY